MIQSELIFIENRFAHHLEKLRAPNSACAISLGLCILAVLKPIPAPEVSFAKLYSQFFFNTWLRSALVSQSSLELAEAQRAAASYLMIIMIRWAIPKSQDFGSIEHHDSLGQTVFR